MATTWYTSTAGSNSNSGTSVSAPFKTVQKGVDSMAAGDTLYVVTGVYREMVTVNTANVTVAGYQDKFFTLDGENKAVFPLTTAQAAAVNYTPMLLISAPGVTAQYVKAINTLGIGIRVTANSVTLDHCETYNTARFGISYKGLYTNRITGAVVSNCKVIACTQVGTGASLQLLSVDGGTVSYCTVTGNFGESLSGSRSKNLNFHHNVVYDNRKAGIYFDCVDTGTIDSNVCYCTDAYKAKYTAIPHGIIIASEYYDGNELRSSDIVVSNNLCIGNEYNILIKQSTDGDATVPGTIFSSIEGAKFYAFELVNNTLINAHDKNVYIRDYGNNLNTVTVSSFGGTWPASHDNVFANNIVIQDGTNDMVGTDSVTRTLLSWTFANNLYSRALSVAMAAKETGEVIDATDKGLLVDYDAALFEAGNYKLQSGSAAIGAASATYAPATDFWGSSRPSGAADDIGAHEYGGAGADLILTAGYSVSPGATITRGAAITFSDDSTEGGGVAITDQEWTFEGGSPSTSTAAAPVVTYNEVGVFGVTYTVTDSVNNRTSTATGSVTVKATGSGTAAAFATSLVTFTGGATTIAHGMDVAPSAVLFVYGQAAADDDEVANATMSIGAWVANGAQYYAATHNPDGAAAKTGESWQGSGAVINNLWDDAQASVSSVDGTNITLSWSGSPISIKGYVLCFGGSGIEAADLDFHEFAPADTSKSRSGTYTALIAFGSGTVLNSSRYGANMSLGFAAAGGGQAVISFSDPRNSTNTYGRAQSGIIAAHDQYSLEYTAAFSGGYTLTRAGTTSNTTGLVVLALNVPGVALAAGLASTPINTSATDYTLAFDPGTLLGALSMATELGRQTGDAGLGVYANDGTTERTVDVKQKHNTLPVFSGAYTDDKFAMIDGAGAVLLTGAVVLGTSKYTTTLATAAAAARYYAYLAIEEQVADVNPRASFMVGFAAYDEQLQPNPRTTDEITFTNLSTAGGAALSSYAWAFGDGDTSTAESPTHTYAAAGTYTVTLVVTDADTNTGTATKTVVVQQGPPTIVLTISVTNDTVPFDTELDWSGSTWGALTIDWYASFICLWSSDDTHTYHKENPWIVYGDEGTTDGVTEYTITEAGVYNVGFRFVATTGQIWTTNIFIFDDSPEYNDLITAKSASGFYMETYPAFTEFVGPLEVTMTMRGLRDDLDTSVFDWDFGDGNTLADDAGSVTNEYAAVTTATSYDVTVDVTYPNGDVEQFVVTDAVTVHPPQIPPIPLATLAAQWATYMWHAGDLSGATWTRQASPNGNVYLAELSHTWAANMTPRVYEDGTALTERASIALCQANAGSYYATNTAGEIAIYVHPLQSDNPNANSNSYRWVD